MTWRCCRWAELGAGYWVLGPELAHRASYCVPAPHSFTGRAWQPQQSSCMSHTALLLVTFVLPRQTAAVRPRGVVCTRQGGGGAGCPRLPRRHRHRPQDVRGWMGAGAGWAYAHVVGRLRCGSCITSCPKCWTQSSGRGRRLLAQPATNAHAPPSGSRYMFGGHVVLVAAFQLMRERMPLLPS